MNGRLFVIAGLTAFSMAAYAGGGAKQSQSDSGMQPQSASQGASHPSQSGQSEQVVKQAQEKLNVTADGKMGPQTQAKLKEFQQSKGLEASGQLDQQTVAALGIEGGQSAATGSSSSPSSSGSPAAAGASDSGSGNSQSSKPESASGTAK